MKYLDGRHIPVFPLTDVVLFPRVLVPLYVFEPRYRALLSDVLDSYGKIAVGLVDPVAESSAEETGTESPSVFDVVGVGHVMAYETRADGTSDVFLLGETRARATAWDRTEDYWLAELETLEERIPRAQTTRDRIRRELKRWVDVLVREGEEARELAERENLRKLRKFFATQKDLGFLVDFLGHQFVEDPAARQRLLEELDVEARATSLYGLLERRQSA
ncbi:MAG TPA: LON peptidase substrate-binding domain-containing protein [Planctomycetota bacterium]|nr:LON peptidase substrate-binding domain-containing protein [Planctomycetota bacterium]